MSSEFKIVIIYNHKRFETNKKRDIFSVIYEIMYRIIFLCFSLSSQWPFKPQWSWSYQARKSEWPMLVIRCKRRHQSAQFLIKIFNTSLCRICAPEWAACHNWTAPLYGYDCRAAIVTGKNAEISLNFIDHVQIIHFPVMDFGSLEQLIGSSRLSSQSSPDPWAHALHRHLAASADRHCTHPIAAPPHLSPS